MTGALGEPGLLQKLQSFLAAAGRFLGRAGFAVVMALAAFAALVATTIIGVMLALAALFLTVSQRLGGRRRKPPVDDTTLEARETADGWVIETRGF